MSIRHKTSVISLNLIKKDLTNEVSIAMIEDAIKIIKEAEATEKELEDTKYQLSVVKDNALKIQNQLVELQRDVKRYYDIRTSCPKGMSIDDWKEERLALEIRLAKVGKEE